MKYKFFQCCTFLFYFTKETVRACRQGPYPSLCGFDDSGYNVTETEDVESICDCQKVIFCALIMISEGCNSTTVQLEVNQDMVFLTQLNCGISSLVPEVQVPVLEVLSSNGNELTVKLSQIFDNGMFRVSCSVSEISNETAKSEWEIVSVSPVEVTVDSEIDLTARINGKQTIPRWCFINTPDNNVEILSATLITEAQISCSGFTSSIPGVFKISMGYDFPTYPLKESVDLNVVGKRPIALGAEYSFHFETILIYFDANIELHSTCNSAFPEIFHGYFGTGFNCYTRGNTLRIKMGAQFKLINTITIGQGNKICREGFQNTRFCPSVLPVNLTVAKPKVLELNFSFNVDSECAINKTQKYLSVKVIDSNPQSLAFKNEILRPEGRGKTQRRNLMLWRIMRQVQTKLSSRLVLQINKTDILPLFENFSALDNVLDVDDGNSGSGASVSVYVQSFPASSSILAEAHVRFCNDDVKLYRHKWIVNGRNMSEDGRLLILDMLPPGKYFIKCLVVAYDSSEILGQGWSSAAVLETVEEVFIIPLEMSVGISHNVFLRAVTRYGNSVTWTCRTTLGEACFLKGQKFVDLSSPDIFLPAGSLPVGDYIWTVESANGMNEAKVFIKPGEVAASVEISSVFVNPFEDVGLHGSLSIAEENCRAGWSSERKKTFSFFNLRSVGVKEISVTGNHSDVKIPLVIPVSSETREGLLADAQYLFKLQVFCPRLGSLGYIKVPVRTIAPPRVSSVIVQPLSGKAMITKFEVSGAEVSAHPNPLVFEWSYVDVCGVETPLERGLSSKNFTTYLPPGEMKILVRVCDLNKICSTSVSPAINVIQAVEIFEENFDETLKRIQCLMASGNALESFGLAVTMFKSLALKAEFEIREKVFATVEEVISLRIKHFEEALQFDSNAVKLSSEFCRRAEAVAKYFRKNSNVLRRLTDFRNRLSGSPFSEKSN